MPLKMPTTRSRWPSPSQSTAKGRVQMFSVQFSFVTGMISGSLVGALQDFRLAERPVVLAVQDLEQPRHLVLHAGIGAGKDVAPAVAIEVHKLWSRAGASPNAGDLGDLAVGLEPVAGRELAVAEIPVDADLPLLELAD